MIPWPEYPGASPVCRAVPSSRVRDAWQRSRSGTVHRSTDGCGASRQRQIAAVRPVNVSEAVQCRLEIGTSSRTILSPSKPTQKASIEASRGDPDRSPADPCRDRDRLRDRPPDRRALSDFARPWRPRAGVHPGPSPHRARARPGPAGLSASAAVHGRGRIADPGSAGERRPAGPALDRPGAVHDGPCRGRGARPGARPELGGGVHARSDRRPDRRPGRHGRVPQARDAADHPDA